MRVTSVGEVKASGEEFDIPARICQDCGEYAWLRDMARYDIGIPNGPDRALVSVSAGWREVSIEEFDRLTKVLDLSAHDRRCLLPGTKIGTPVLRLSTPARDCVSHGLVELISERAVDCLRARSINIEVAPIEVISSGKSRIRYFNLLIPVLNLMDEDWMSIQLEQCKTCKEWWRKLDAGRPTLIRSGNARIVRSRWPEGEGVVYSRELRRAYYSPEFVRACEEAKLTGFGFQEVSWA
jgi:hypothetical protein